MRHRTTPFLMAFAVSGFLEACVRAPEPKRAAADLPDPELMAAPEEPGTPWEQCQASFSPTGSAVADLERLTGACGPIGGLRPVTAVQTGQQNESDPVDRYSFYVPEPGRCYRVYAAGDETVQNLDLALRDPKGKDLVADRTHDRVPVIPRAEPICVDEPGAYLLEVGVYRGSGRYAVQVWGN